MLLREMTGVIVRTGAYFKNYIKRINAISGKMKISLALRLFVHLAKSLNRLKYSYLIAVSLNLCFCICANKAKNLPLHFLDTSVIRLFKISAVTGKPGREGKLSSPGRVCARFMGTLKLTTLK